ncbi:hypothetical protein AERO8C_120518 [Aeromonas veronii]|uniref:Uncharacterized protein n=1 Tax=Aeromonas veronii TaxID=654 RepID=A0A653KTP5_AERVE|nr:hypothetical protein AERO8C_120518 [Aeromonas veronii]
MLAQVASSVMMSDLTIRFPSLGPELSLSMAHASW